MTTDIVTDALSMAWFRRWPAPGLIHHSGRSRLPEFNRSSQHPNFKELQWAKQNTGGAGEALVRELTLEMSNGASGWRSPKVVQVEAAAIEACVSPAVGARWFRQSGGAPAILQIFHAGNQAVPHLVPNGRVVSASALKVPPSPFNEGEVISHALIQKEIEEIITAFGETTRRAIEAGFDDVELHGAHGFLIQIFFSPMFNQRDDKWGGSLENRMRFPLAVVREVQRVIAEHAKQPFLLGYRISLEESDVGGLRIGDTHVLIDRLIETSVNYERVRSFV